MTTQDIKPGYKQSPLGPIPDNWEIKSLKEIGNFFRGHSYDATNVCDNGLLVIRSSNIQNNGIDIENDLQFVNNECNKNILLQKNDIVICMANGSRELVGKTGKYLGNYTGKITVGAFCAIFRGGNNFSRFIFNSPLYKKYMHFLLAGTNINNLKITDLEKMEFPLPPLPEQETIANILGKVDETIEKTQNMIDKLELRNKGLQQQLLTGEKRLPGFSEKWNTYMIDDVTTQISRRNKDLIDAEVYSVTNKNGFVIQTEHFSKEVAGEDLTNYKIIKNGEFAYNPARINVGSIALFENDLGVISSLYVCFKTKSNLSKYFLNYLLKTNKMKYDIDRYGEGGVRIYLWYYLFNKIRVKLPSIKEQNEIVKILDKATEQLNLYKQKLEKLQELKKGLMQQLLTGKVRVKEFRN